jgi:hypothetical protein
MAGWTTPQAHDTSGRSTRQKAIHGTRHGCACLVRDADLAGWPTTTTTDSKSSARHGYMVEGNQGTTLLDAARLAGWATPVATELGNTLENYVAMKQNMRSGPRTAITHPSLQAQLATPARLTASGHKLTGSSAGTASGGQLSPAHSRWLMSYPEAWDQAAPGSSAWSSWQRSETESAGSGATATPSCPSSPRL